jgi:dTDP-4-dehydrorhamnose reductase
MLGTELSALLARKGFEPGVFDLPEFDIRDEHHVRAALDGAYAVINCAAYTQVDRAESERELCRAVNADAVGTLGAVAARRCVYVLHVGTDFVFDGALDRPYREDDEARPLSVYGATKLDGERQLQESGCRNTILRIEWTYGAAGANFVTKLLERARSGAAVKMVSDQVGAPTWTRDVAATLIELLDQQATGLYHYAAAGYASRLQVAQRILEECGLDTHLVPCLTADFSAPAMRPLNSRFDCRRIDALLNRPRPRWEDSLRAFLEAADLI